ncbi:M23 family metallopeptidase [Amphibacillus cookii]|uniref:M23 family metallopeptidase n=1 Tax=Amphibacillus cookii TaxID=767787 RepID=UPI00195B51AF|nr:M23 family metallopeptidase [Amphibacillus cookii]MBM7541443.1 murein DD-endopeptidase MepM/ murein hydrolase activator NlpD [Amphibacillus cookii]
MKKYLIAIFLISSLLPIPHLTADEEHKPVDRLTLYKKTESLTLIPWYYLAAIDQYERQIHDEKELVAITFPETDWYGVSNLNHDPSITSVTIHNGIGKDGNGDGEAQIDNPEDQLYTMADYILSYGLSKNDIHLALWEHYQRPLAVKTIVQNAKIYETYQTIELTDRAFPVPEHFNYSYRSTWGDARGFGGRRIHEGTDIFADYGTPVRATTYGTIEIMGWNRYGGWRLGIRDLNNVYHYFAHLNGFEKDREVGDIVEPGDVIGYVGSSGYGPPGTSGKFPPHLHYGMYKDNGENEWAFDPYPFLRKWEN